MQKVYHHSSPLCLIVTGRWNCAHRVNAKKHTITRHHFASQPPVDGTAHTGHMVAWHSEPFICFTASIRQQSATIADFRLREICTDLLLGNTTFYLEIFERRSPLPCIPPVAAHQARVREIFSCKEPNGSFTHFVKEKLDIVSQSPPMHHFPLPPRNLLRLMRFNNLLWLLCRPKGFYRQPCILRAPITQDYWKSAFHFINPQKYIQGSTEAVHPLYLNRKT